MKATGLTQSAANAAVNEASRALYKACGFTPWYILDDYVRPVWALTAG